MDVFSSPGWFLSFCLQCQPKRHLNYVGPFPPCLSQEKSKAVSRETSSEDYRLETGCPRLRARGVGPSAVFRWPCSFQEWVLTLVLVTCVFLTAPRTPLGRRTLVSWAFLPEGRLPGQARQRAQLTAPPPLPSLWGPQALGKELSYTLVPHHTFPAPAPAVSVKWPH